MIEDIELVKELKALKKIKDFRNKNKGLDKLITKHESKIKSFERETEKEFKRTNRER